MDNEHLPDLTSDDDLTHHGHLDHAYGELVHDHLHDFAFDPSWHGALDHDFGSSRLEPFAAGSDSYLGAGAGTEVWHQQEHGDTCGVVAQEYILNSHGGDFTEDGLRQEAIDHGWYVPGAGTPVNHIGDQLEFHGIDVDRSYGATIDDLHRALDDGQQVLVAVDSNELLAAGHDSPGGPLSETWGIPGQDVNHTVQVLRIDDADPAHPMVVLNDPGSPNGQGLEIPLDRFTDAWADSGHFLMQTTGDPVHADTTNLTTGAEAMVGYTAPGVSYSGTSDMVAGKGTDSSGRAVDSLGYSR